MAELEKLTIQDAENAQNAILSLILKYPNYPASFSPSNQTIKWSSINADTSIGLFPLQGAAYLGKYVDGSYLAQLPLQIVFKSSPTTNKGNIDAQTMVENLAKWLESCDIAFEGNMWLESIERTSTVYAIKFDEKTNGYGININVRYMAEN